MTLKDHSASMKSRKIALTTPVTVITGMPAIRRREIGEFSNISFRRQGRMAAAIEVPRKVIAITPVAQRNQVWMLGAKDHARLIRIAGTIMKRSAPYGTRRFEEMFAANSGSTRSKAAAKMTRVDDRKRVPAQPKNHRPMTTMRRAWARGLPTRQQARM